MFGHVQVLVVAIIHVCAYARVHLPSISYGRYISGAAHPSVSPSLLISHYYYTVTITRLLRLYQYHISLCVSVCLCVAIAITLLLRLYQYHMTITESLCHEYNVSWPHAR